MKDVIQKMKDVIQEIRDTPENIILIYAFNATGKTLLSVGYKEFNRTDEYDKAKKGAQTGIYYNAYTEDLFHWDNDFKNDEPDIKLEIESSNLNDYHQHINEADVLEILIPFNPKYKFFFTPIDAADPQKGIKHIQFFLEGDEEKIPRKISRGEERLFIFCFFIALASIEDWNREDGKYIYIDDPVSSLDDNNIYITSSILLNLIEQNYKKKKIIISTHHMGLLSILDNKLRGGKYVTKHKEKDDKGDDIYRYEYEHIVKFLDKSLDDKYRLTSKKKGIRLYHLLLLDILNEAIEKKEIYPYHFALLRQLLENINSFIGKQGFSYVLEKIGRPDANADSYIINSIVHERDYTLKIGELDQDQKNILVNIVEDLKKKFSFSI